MILAFSSYEFSVSFLIIYEEKHKWFSYIFGICQKNFELFRDQEYKMVRFTNMLHLIPELIHVINAHNPLNSD